MEINAMKKSLLALAALGMFAGAASAQSTVTLFGIVDAGIARLSAKTTTGSKSVTGMTNSGLNSSVWASAASRIWVAA
jgi:predicted porin